MSLLKKEHYKIVVLYILFGFGGLWHVLNVFQKSMKLLASPLIIGVSLLLVYIVWKSLSDSSKPRFLLWCFIILLGGWGIELLGVYTHFPFGHYQYGHVLEPKILQIPLAIGFAWLSICLSSLMIVYRLIHFFQLKETYHHYIIPFMTGAFMLLFDVVMENASTKLDYWTWHHHTIPIQNYLSWFLLGSVFSDFWLRLKLSMNVYPIFGIHVYLSQFLYFVLVLFE